jgi:hypothetical protein
MERLADMMFLPVPLFRGFRSALEAWKMHRRHLIIFGVASSLLLSVDAQARPTISTDAVPGVNFSAYRTYSWVNTAPPGGMNPVLYQRIMADFDSALASHGYQKADQGDLALGLTLGAQNKTDVESWGRFGLQTSVYQYTEGQMSLDAFDAKTKQALWHGQITETFNPAKPNQAAIDSAISKLMQKFPATAAVPAAAPPKQ